MRLDPANSDRLGVIERAHDRRSIVRAARCRRAELFVINLNPEQPPMPPVGTFDAGQRVRERQPGICDPVVNVAACADADSGVTFGHDRIDRRGNVSRGYVRKKRNRKSRLRKTHVGSRGGGVGKIRKV